jgi:cytidine deaminase
MSDGKVYTGANVENSSFGGTICAERAAIHTAITQGHSHKIKEILVVTDANPPWPPCGLCRQVISEFGTPQTRVTGTNLAGGAQSFTFGELLPHAFTPGHLLK